MASGCEDVRDDCGCCDYHGGLTVDGKRTMRPYAHAHAYHKGKYGPVAGLTASPVRFYAG